MDAQQTIIPSKKLNVILAEPFCEIPPPPPRLEKEAGRVEDVDEIEAYARISRRGASLSIHCDAKRGPNRAQTPLQKSSSRMNGVPICTGIHHATLVIIITIKNRLCTICVGYCVTLVSF